MTDVTKYYKAVERHLGSQIPKDAELVAEEYRGFLISRADSEYLLWKIETKEGGLPPLDLRSLFTTKGKAQTHIDSWWKHEDERELAIAKANE